jgi:DNA-binding transcriptional regulator YiaG
MTPEDVKRIRMKLGYNQIEMAAALRLGPNGDRSVRRWEKGEIEVSGPVSLALEYLEKGHVGSKKNA